MPGHFHVLVVNDQVRGVQHDPDLLSDQTDGNRVAVGADWDLAARTPLKDAGAMRMSSNSSSSMTAA
jgi:hypothetical protein